MDKKEIVLFTDGNVALEVPITPESLKMRVLLEIRYNLAKPLISAKVYTVWQKIYLVAKVKNY